MTGPADSHTRRDGAALGPAQERVEHLYRQIFEQAPIPCVVVDAQGVVRDCNRAARLVLGPEIGSGTIDRYVAETDRDVVRGLLSDCEHGWSDVTVQLGCPRGPRQMQIDCAPIDDDLMIVLMHDVTELADAHARVVAIADHNWELVARLRELNDIRQLLLLTVSHDLRTPMAAIAGLAGVLESHGGLSDDERHLIAERIHTNADWVVEQFAHILDVHRIEAGNDVLRREPVDLRAVVNGCLGRLDLGDRLIITELDAITAAVDQTLFERIVDNLLRNTHRHTPPETNIWVRCGGDEGRIFLVVEDDGPGVPDDLVPRLFQLFQRDRRPDAAEGLGVGLYLVRRFAELHGGTAWYQHREGGGAAFHVSLSDL